MPSWTDVLRAISESWRRTARRYVRAATGLRERLTGGASLSPSPSPPTEQELDGAVEGLRESYDAATAVSAVRRSSPRCR